MSTLPIRVPHVNIPTVPFIARLVAGVTTMLDVFAEAQIQARAMQKKYPYMSEE